MHAQQNSSCDIFFECMAEFQLEMLKKILSSSLLYTEATFAIQTVIYIIQKTATHMCA